MRFSQSPSDAARALGEPHHRPRPRAGPCRGENEWKVTEVQGLAPDRLVPAATAPLLDVDDAVAELHHAAGLGLHLVSLPTGVPEGVDDWHYDTWEPLWAAAEETAMVLGFHIGSDGTADGPTCSAGRAAPSSTTWRPRTAARRWPPSWSTPGALDRHADLLRLISEGGANAGARSSATA